MSRGARKILALLLWSLMVPETPGRAQPDDSGIWGEAIMAQPFDTVPFRAVKIPEWVKETAGCGYTLSVLDSAGRARAAAHGVTISEIGFVDPFYAYYDSKLLKLSPRYPFRSVHLEPEGIDLKAQPVPDGTSVVVPRLDVHSMVVGELE